MLGATATLGTLDGDPPHEEEQPRRGEDYDLLSWPRSLSVSPRLYPTLGQPSTSASTLDNSAPTAALSHYRGLGDHSPLLLARNHLSTGTGLSPILGPSAVSTASSSSHAPASTSAFDYTSFSQYHLHHPLESTPLPRPKSEKQSSPFNLVRQSASPDLIKRGLSPRAQPGVLPDLKPKNEGDTSAPSEEACVQAYAKLEFPTFDIFIQKLSVIVGRRPAAAALAPAQGAAVAQVEPPVAETQAVKLEDFVNGMEDESGRRSSQPPVAPASDSKVAEDEKTKVKEELPTVEITPSSPARQASVKAASRQASPIREQVTNDTVTPSDQTSVPSVDVDLGPIRAVSRQHARLFFDYQVGGWVIEVLGRNGVVVDGKWTAKGERERLGARTRIQIAERIFFFVLPDAAGPGEQDDLRAKGGLSADDDEHDDDTDDDADSIDFSSSLSEVSEIADDSSVRQSRLGKGKGKGLVALEAVRKAGKGKGKGKAASSKAAAAKARKGKAPKALQSLRRPSRGSADEDDDQVDRMDEDDPSEAEAGREAAGSKSTSKRRGRPSKADSAAAGTTSALPKKQPKKIREGAAPSLPSEAGTPGGDAAMATPSAAGDDSGADDGRSDNEGSPSENEEGTVASESASTTAAPSNPYAIPPPPPSASTSAATAAPPASEDGTAPSVPGTPAAVDPNKPIKRGRGRPPKNGVAAQRRKKPATPTGPKIDPELEAAGSIEAPGPPEGDTEPGQFHGPWPAGEEMPPLAAPESDRMQKPPYTYASLIAQAVQSSKTRKLTLHGIYDWITDRWPYFTDNQNGWQNSIRHNLTLSRGFLKIPRRPEEPGKGSFWAIDPPQLRNFDGRHFRKKNLKPTTPAAGAPPKPKPIVTPAASTSTGSTTTTAPKPPLLASTGTPAPRPVVPASSNAPSAPSVTTAPKPPGPPATVNGKPATTVANKPTGPPRPVTTATPSGSGTATKPATTGTSSTTATTAAKPGTTGTKPPTKPPPNLSVPLPIIVAPIPDTYVRPPPPPTANGQPPDELTLALLKDPPIILHEGRLILNPTIFAKLEQEQLTNLQKIPASQALQTLQAFVVQYFKDKMKREAAERERIRKEREAKGLPPRPPVKPGVAAKPGTPGAASKPGTPGVASKPGPPGAARPVTAAGSRPATPGTAIPKPGTAPGPSKPGTPGVAGKPVTPATATRPGAPVSRPVGTPATSSAPGSVPRPAGSTVRPPGTTATPGVARPAGAANGTAPRPATAGTPARPAQAATGSATGPRPAGTPASTVARPGQPAVAKGSTTSAVTSTGPRPSTGTPAARPAVQSSTARPAGTTTPGTAMAKPGTATTPRPSGTPQGTTTTAPRPNGTTTPSTQPRPAGSTSVPARPAGAVAGATTTTPAANRPAGVPGQVQKATGTQPVVRPNVAKTNASPALAKPGGPVSNIQRPATPSTAAPARPGAPAVAKPGTTSSVPARPATPSTSAPAAQRAVPAAAQGKPSVGAAPAPKVATPQTAKSAPAPATATSTLKRKADDATSTQAPPPKKVATSSTTAAAPIAKPAPAPAVATPNAPASTPSAAPASTASATPASAPQKSQAPATKQQQPQQQQRPAKVQDESKTTEAAKPDTIVID